MLGDRPELVNGVPAVPPIKANGPDSDVELNTWYHTAPAEAVHDMVIWLGDVVVAVSPVGTDGGCGVVVLSVE